MNPNWTDVQDWLDLLDHAWYGIVLIAVAAVPSWLSYRNHKSIKEVSDSVNNRPTALRDDLDRAIAAIESLAHDVQSMRRDLMAEEDHRRIQINDLREELDHRTGKHRRL